jgi:hypothetical protein
LPSATSGPEDAAVLDEWILKNWDIISIHPPDKPVHAHPIHDHSVFLDTLNLEQMQIDTGIFPWAFDQSHGDLVYVRCPLRCIDCVVLGWWVARNRGRKGSVEMF